MHELSLMNSVVEAVESVARDTQAKRVVKISLNVGKRNGAVEELLEFAFEALVQDNPLLEGAKLDIQFTEGRGIDINSIEIEEST